MSFSRPAAGAPITVTSLEDGVATYRGNALANAQALVAKAAPKEGRFRRATEPTRKASNPRASAHFCRKYSEVPLISAGDFRRHAIVLGHCSAMASSGIASLLLEGARTVMRGACRIHGLELDVDIDIGRLRCWLRRRTR